MNQFSEEILKTLIEINSEINKDYSDKGALLFRILRSAMRLVSCELCSFVSFESGSRKLRITASLLGNDEIKCSVLLDHNSIASEVVTSGNSLIANDVLSNTFFQEKIKDKIPVPVSNILVVPVYADSKCIGALELVNKSHGLLFVDEDKAIIEKFRETSGNALKISRKITEQKEQILALKTNKQISNGKDMHFHDFIAESPAILDLIEIIKKAAQTNSTILLNGESGVGKELFAEQIYLYSKRVDMPFIRVNCASLSDTLMESELFGHIKGAYTSADSEQKGRFEMADGGTIFLDEVGEIPLNLQPKLLRVIQDKQFERVGSSQTINVDVRIIAATNRNLAEMVRKGTFREDLYFRLNVLPVRIPPLRSRKQDIIPIASSFLVKYSEETGKDFTGFSENARTALENYSWPGNVRELENLVARSCILGTPPLIQSSDFRFEIEERQENKTETDFNEAVQIVSSRLGEDRSLKAAQEGFKKAYVIKILEECGWNQTKASKILGIQRTYVSRLMNELKIREDK